MSYSSKWLKFRKLEDEYFACRYAFMQNEGQIIDDLNTALSMPNDTETALRLLIEMTPGINVIISLMQKILDICIDSSNLNAIKLSRNILYNYKNNSTIRIDIKKFSNYYLKYDDEWNYRRIAELYKLLDYKEELADFALLCKSNDNIEIQEIGNDFPYVED